MVYNIILFLRFWCFSFLYAHAHDNLFSSSNPTAGSLAPLLRLLPREENFFVFREESQPKEVSPFMPSLALEMDTLTLEVIEETCRSVVGEREDFSTAPLSNNNDSFLAPFSESQDLETLKRMSALPKSCERKQFNHDFAKAIARVYGRGLHRKIDYQDFLKQHMSFNIPRIRSYAPEYSSIFAAIRCIKERIKVSIDKKESSKHQEKDNVLHTYFKEVEELERYGIRPLIDEKEGKTPAVKRSRKSSQTSLTERPLKKRRSTVTQEQEMIADQPACGLLSQNGVVASQVLAAPTFILNIESILAFFIGNQANIGNTFGIPFPYIKPSWLTWEELIKANTNQEKVEKQRVMKEFARALAYIYKTKVASLMPEFFIRDCWSIPIPAGVHLKKKLNILSKNFLSFCAEIEEKLTAPNASLQAFEEDTPMYIYFKTLQDLKVIPSV